MTSSPLISVLMPSYNHESYVGKAIQSVLDQTFDDFELVVVDDGSTDNSREIISGFNDPRIRTIFQENAGPSQAANRALQESKGELTAFHSSDDMSDPTRLAKQADALLTDPELDIVATHIAEINSNGDKLTPDGDIGRWFNHALDLNHPESWIWQNKLASPTILCRRSVFDECGAFDPGLIYTQDWAYWMHAVLGGRKIRVVPQPLYLYRFHGENLTHKDPARTVWEYAYISTSTLHPALSAVGDSDSIVANIKGFLTNGTFKAFSRQEKISLLALLLRPCPKGKTFLPAYEEVHNSDVSSEPALSAEVAEAIFGDLMNRIEEHRQELADLSAVCKEQEKWIDALEKGKVWLNEQRLTLLHEVEALMAERRRSQKRIMELEAEGEAPRWSQLKQIFRINRPLSALNQKADAVEQRQPEQANNDGQPSS